MSNNIKSNQRRTQSLNTQTSNNKKKTKQYARTKHISTPIEIAIAKNANGMILY